MVLGILIFLGAIVGVGLLLIFVAIGMYNSIVTLRNRYKNAYAQIDVQLKRRYDLIPNLVETAKGYIKHERETLEAVIKARNAAFSAGEQAAKTPGDPKAMTALGGAEAQLTGGARSTVRRGRSLPRPKGQPEHDGPSGGADRHGKQGRLRQTGIQRRRYGL